MSIDKTAGIDWESLGLARPEEKKRTEDVGQEQFLELMLAQLQNQDPLKPMENGEFLSQMAQFSSAKGIQEMSQSLDTFTQSLTSSQALQASSLIGRHVLVPNEMGYLEEGSAGIAMWWSASTIPPVRWCTALPMVPRRPGGSSSAGMAGMRMDKRFRQATTASA